MRLVLDLQGAQTESRHRGIGRYTMALARGIIRNAGDHEVWVGLAASLPDTLTSIRESLADVLPENRIAIWHSVTPTGDAEMAHDGRRAQSQVVREAFLASLDPDVVHCSSAVEGFAVSSVTSIHQHFQGPPTAATLYDLIPLIDRHRYLVDPAMERWYRQRLAELRRADLLLAISEHTEREARELLQFPPERVVNIRAAADDIFRPVAVPADRESALRRRFGLDRPFVMFTGGVDVRKNIKGLISAFAMLPTDVREAHQLALVGSSNETIDRQNKEHAVTEGLRPDQVVFTGFVSDDDIVALYNLSAGFVFPSQYEGFGLPPLEAMSCGAPTIASSTTSIPEVIGDPAAMFDPYDPSDMSAKVLRLLTDTTFREGLRERGLERAKTFSWDDSAKRALTAFEKLVGRSGASRAGTGMAPRVAVTTPRRPRLALTTALPKRPSAERDTIVQLVELLDLHYSVDIVTEGEIDPGLFEGPARVVSAAAFDLVSGDYDRIVHHYANTADFGHVRDVQAKHPGIVLLSDYFLDRALSSATGELDPTQSWMQSVIEAYGYDTLYREMTAKLAGAPTPRLPLNRAVLETAHGVIVTDPRITELAKQDLGDEATKNWVTVPLLVPERASALTSQPGKVIAAFGEGSRHLHHRLVAAWLASPMLSGDGASELVIVGPSPDDPYGRHLVGMLSQAAPGSRWRVISSDDAGSVLSDVRFAVQLLRAQDSAVDRWLRGCTVRGAPTLTVDELGDGANPRDLATALEETWQRSSLPTEPEPVSSPAIAYRDAIERVHADGRLTQQMQVLRVAARQPALSGADWPQTVTAVMRNHPVSSSSKQLLLDLTMMVLQDARTGIQRVTRSLARCLLESPPAGYRVEPVYWDDESTLRYARRYATKMLGFDGSLLRDDPVVVQPGDVFAGLDLNARMFPREITWPGMAASLEWFRSRGVSRQFVIYDLLPCRHPDWFPWSAHLFPGYLLNLARHADALLCISESTAGDLQAWLRESAPEREIAVDWFHLGADIEKSVPSDHLTEDFEVRWANRGPGPSILMVGTLEPRKGYDQAFAAFSALWDEGVDANLVIVGHAGWGCEELVRSMRTHPAWGRRLLWFEGASDDELMRLYQLTDGCLMASRGEGFGLPIIECARYDVPVLARDLAVFEEIAGENITYFSGESPDSLASSLRPWFAQLEADTAPRSGGIRWLTWEESTQQFLAALQRQLAD